MSMLYYHADRLHYAVIGTPNKHEVEQGFYPAVNYLGRNRLAKASKHYGGDIIKFERPQVLMINGEPAYLYAPSGYHFFGKESTASYVLKFKQH